MIACCALAVIEVAICDFYNYHSGLLSISTKSTPGWQSITLVESENGISLY
jgi:hypothetical protein